MNNNTIGRTSLKICENIILIGIAVNCISCFFGNDVCKFFYTISPLTVTILLLPIIIILRKELIKERILLYIIGGFSLFALIVSLFITGLNLSYVLTAVIGIVTLYVMSHIILSRDFQFVLIIFLSIVSITLFLLAINYSWMTLVEKYNYTNSNVMGLLTLVVDAYLMVLISNNGVTKKILHLNVFVAIFSFATITVFGCRSAQLGFLVFLIIAFAFPKLFCGKKRMRIILILGMVVGMIFPFIYLKMLESGADNIVFPLIDKPWFSGRDILWKQSVEWLKETPLSFLFGIGSNYVQIPLGYNFHNSYISILVCFGIPATVAYFYSMFRCSELSIRRNEDNRFKSMQLALICMILVVSLVETTIPATTFIWMYGICFIPISRQKSI